MNKDILEYKKREFTEKLENWKSKFVELKSKLISFENTALTMAKLTEIQYLVDDFVRYNDIHIKLYVNQIDQDIVIMGRTLEDELVWESIQRI